MTWRTLKALKAALEGSLASFHGALRPAHQYARTRASGRALGFGAAQGDLGQFGPLDLRRNLGQFVEHDALIQSRTRDFGQDVGRDVLAAGEVAADGAGIDAKVGRRLSRIGLGCGRLAP